MIKKIDAYIKSYFPLLVAGYFIYNNSYFATHIFLVCWMSMAINMSISLETYDKILTRKNSTSSVLNLLFFCTLAMLGVISAKGFLLGIIIGENTALIMAFMVSFIQNKDMKGRLAAQSSGVTMIIGFVLLFSATIYPYIGEWFLHLLDDFEWLIIIEAIVSFGISISGKIKTLDLIKANREDIRKRSYRNKALKIRETRRLSNVNNNVLFALGIWFVVGSVMYAVSVLGMSFK